MPTCCTTRTYRLSRTAERRLKAIFESTELGAGFQIALEGPGDPRRRQYAGQRAARPHGRRRASSSTATCWPKPSNASAAATSRSRAEARGPFDQPANRRLYSVRLRRGRESAPAALSASGRLELHGRRRRPGSRVTRSVWPPARSRCAPSWQPYASASRPALLDIIRP